MSTDTQNNAPVIAEAFSIPAALREIASWMDSGGPTYHEAELIGMNIAGPTGCGAHKECTRAAKLAFLEAARIWERLHPSSPVGAEPVLRIGTDRNGELAIFTPRFNSVIARFTPCGKSGMKEGLLYSAPVAAQPDVTQQTLDDVMAGIPARDAEIEALRMEIEAQHAAQAQQSLTDADIDRIAAPWLHPDGQANSSDIRAIVRAIHAQQPVSGADDAPERALAELVDKIMPGLDTGDLLADAATASKTLDSAKQDADKVDAALAEMVHAMFRSGNSVPVTRITIDRKQYDAAIDAARKELDQ
ncbi:hypothetical protein GCM10010096_34840 [Alcaligenes pakistanensis]|uniref:Uncharacterized protein n=1 Tax=Alcaligenes pakistanensis TaxID=1482717 RepID=A0A8H9IPM6_9BURK|nr:hypothetical protein [Alcaligenes pakistanensis]GHC58721.1 hypothetical protein GCM10010096_34840 [Alcaligenes pakistanensis]